MPGGATPWDTSSGGSNAETPADDIGAAGLRKGVIHTPEQEAGVREKAKSGGVITNADMDPRNYLGHFANENVMKQGHNVGAPKNKVKQQVSVPTAKRGFRKLPGTAVNQIGQARFGEAPTGLPPPRHVREAQAKMDRQLKRQLKKIDVVPMTMPARAMNPGPSPRVEEATKKAALTGHTRRAGGPPDVKSDVKMSIRHHEDSIKYNTRHAEDHAAQIAKHERELKQTRKQLRRVSKKG